MKMTDGHWYYVFEFFRLKWPPPNEPIRQIKIRMKPPAEKQFSDYKLNYHTGLRGYTWIGKPNDMIYGQAPSGVFSHKLEFSHMEFISSTGVSLGGSMEFREHDDHSEVSRTVWLPDKMGEKMNGWK